MAHCHRYCQYKQVPYEGDALLFFLNVSVLDGWQTPLVQVWLGGTIQVTYIVNVFCFFCNIVTFDRCYRSHNVCVPHNVSGCPSGRFLRYKGFDKPFSVEMTMG